MPAGASSLLPSAEAYPPASSTTAVPTTSSTTTTTAAPSTSSSTTTTVVSGGGPTSTAAPTTTVTPTTTAPAQHSVTMNFGVGDNLSNGLTATFTGNVLKPLSSFTVEVRSTPVTVFSGTADAQGRYNVTVTIPKNTPAGAHTVVLVGTSPSNQPFTDSGSMTISANGTVTGVSGSSGSGGPTTVPAGGLPATGTDTFSMVQLATVVGGAGVALLIVATRRRRPAA
ncbi:MAG: hypothetical protein WCO88_09875 [Actinomycetota bacterium]